MRVHYHLPTGFVGGAERQLQYLLKYALRLAPKDKFTPFVSYESLELAEFVKELGVQSYYVRDRKRLFHALENSSPDIIQFFTSPLVYRTLNLLRHKPRVIEVIHNKNQFAGDATSYPKDRTELAICVSPDAQNFILEHCAGLRTMIIPNGVDQERFNLKGRKPDLTPVFGFAGRLCKDKGVDHLVELAASMPSVRFELVGQDFGGYWRVLPKNMKLYPQTNEPELFYKRWWGFVSASPHESFGLAIAEALACGCPPVMLDCGGITGYLEHGKDAAIVRDMAGMEQWVGTMAATAGFALAPGPDFSAEAMAKAYLDVYNDAPGTVTLQRLPRSLAPPRPEPVPADIFKTVDQRPHVPGGALGITPRGWYGVIRALAGSCDHYADPADAIKAIELHRPRVVVLGCYQEGWAKICAHAHRRGAKVVGTWHASFILNEFHEINRTWMGQLFDAYKAGLIDHLATPHRGLSITWTNYGYKTAWLPNIIDTTLTKRPKLPGVNIGIFGSAQSWKNMECQIAAAGMVKGATIHVQAPPSAIIGRFKIPVTVHPKTLTDDQYYNLVGGMTVNMCVSLSEVYSYLTAESFLMETPVLASSITPVLDSYALIALDSEDVEEACGTEFFEDPTTMLDDLEELIGRAVELGPRCRRHMLAVNQYYLEQCAAVMETWK